MVYMYSTTLTQSEQGLPPEFEFVGVPSMIRKEKGTATLLILTNVVYHYFCHDINVLSRSTLGIMFEYLPLLSKGLF